MPPKQKGQNVRGREKLFRNAVEHVHVGVGHTVLGDLTLALAASTGAAGARTTAEHDQDRPAFYLELNEQLLSCSSKDFKKFRYEVLDLCETRALMEMSHRRIAEKLLVCLLDRSGGAVGNRAKSKAAKSAEGKGETSEGFAAFVRLTIAFARDVGAKFFTYFQVFHEAVHAGLFDRHGFLMADTARVQLVFSAQAAWCREMVPYWCLPAQRRLVERSLGHYVALLSDSRSFIRRLAAELLAYTCRLVHPLLPLVVETISGELLDDFQKYAVRQRQPTRAVKEALENLDDEANDDADELTGEDEDAPVAKEEGTPLASVLAPEEVWSTVHAARYVKEVLPNHPVTDGFAFFCAELMRGIRGSLSSSFEYFYVMVLENGLLLTSDEKKKALAEDEVLMAAFGYEGVGEQWMDKAAPEGTGVAKEEEEEVAAHARDGGLAALHADRYAWVFTGETRLAHTVAGRAHDQRDLPDASAAAAAAAAAIPTAQEVVRALVSGSLQSALQAVLREVRANSGKHAHSDSEDVTSGSDDDEEREVNPQARTEADALTATHQRATSRLLHAVVTLLVPHSAHHIRILHALLSGAYYSLWRDAREGGVLRRLAVVLLASLKAPPPSSVSGETRVTVYGALLELLVPLCLSPYQCHPHSLRAGVMQGVSRHAGDSHAVAVQKAFLPVGRAVVQRLLSLASSGTDATTTSASTSAVSAEMPVYVKEAARVTLYAFAQDVLQKQFAFDMAEERRAAEEAATTSDVANASEDEDTDEDAYVPDDQDGDLGSFTSGKRLDEQRTLARARQADRARARRAHRAESTLKIKSLLTPLALTLLHALCEGYWHLANDALATRLAAVSSSSSCTAVSSSDDAGHLETRHIERAVLLLRLTHDRTRHVASSPLQQLLRLRPQAKASATAGLALRECVEKLFRHMMQLFVRRTEQVLTLEVTRIGAPVAAQLAAVFENELELLACCLPVCRDFLALPPSPAQPTAVNAADGVAAEEAGAVTVPPALLEPLHQVLDVLGRWVAAGPSLQQAVISLASPSGGYALYAQIVSVLIHINSRAGAVSNTSPSSSPSALTSEKKTKRSAPIPKVRHAGASEFTHLARTIDVLAAAFEASKASTAALLSGAASTPPDVSSATVGHMMSEGERGQLLYATQVLLRSLLWSLGLPEDAHTAGKTLSEHTRHALHTLHHALSKDCQARLVQSILLESLVSPMQSVRLLTLRLLVWLCHADLPEDDRLCGLSSVDTDLLVALVRAEEFNPLSATGNLDGLKQVLAKVTFAAEAGTLVGAFERCLLARAMMGLYYLKFSGAWPLATRVLLGLVRAEQTAPSTARTDEARGVVGPAARSDDDDDDDAASEGHEHTFDAITTSPSTANADARRSRRRRLEPVVWNMVIVPNARLMVIGDILARGSPNVRRRSDENDEGGDGHNNDDDDVVNGDAVRSQKEQLDEWETYRCPYTITLTDQQQYEKGATVSRAFSSEQYTDEVIAAVGLTNEDGEVLSWHSHWVGQLYRATTSSFFARSTDRATLAQTFLAALEAMMAHSSAFDTKLRLVEDLVLELVAVDRHEHPCGATQLRKLDDRLALAMRACAAAPTTILSPSQQTRVEPTLLAHILARNDELRKLFVDYTANTSAVLQRAALDNLKRLRVEPFQAHHAHLTPYCDTMKGLFGFLSSFHLDSIPPSDRADYVSTAITLSLPKLIAKVSKEKRRDQAVLQRRLMAFLTELAATTTTRDEADAVTHVLDRVTQRLVLSRVATSDELTDVAAFDFTAQWRDVVARASDRHAVRHLERQARQLTHATRLLQSLLGAVGQHFASYVRSCLHLALQGYLVACRQQLRDVLEARLEAAKAALACHADDADDDEVLELRRVRRWCEEAQRATRARTFTLTLVELRRATVTVVALLFEQFPTESMAAVAEMASDTPVRDTILGRYITALYASAKGATQPRTETSTRGPSTPAKSTVTPMLRLLMAWVSRGPLLSLVPAFGEEVAGTFAELFAVNPLYLEAKMAGAGRLRRALPPVHKAPAAAVYDALRCLTDLLTRGDEPVQRLGPAHLATSSSTAKRSAKKGPAAVTTTTTLQEAFLSTHVTAMFTSVYQLIMHGEADDGVSGEEDKAERTGESASRHTTGGRFSVMAFSVPMWKEVIRTVSMLAQQMQPRVAHTTTTTTTTTAVAGGHEATQGEVHHMLGRLLEVSLKFVVHPICVTDVATVVMAVQVVHQLFQHLERVDLVRHYRPLVHLFNTVTNPEARLLLCETVKRIVPKLHLTSVVGTGVDTADAPVGTVDKDAVAHALAAQMAAMARAVACLNSFEDNNESLDRYDFDLRYHTLHSLQQFFANNGNYGALGAGGGPTSHRSSSSTTARDTVRHERDYSGELDVRLPVVKQAVPVLAIPAFQLLAANVMYFLRDPEVALRSQAVQLFYAMMRYASSPQHEPLYPAGYAALVLDHVVRHGEVLSTLRHGVVARDVHVRNDHMSCFGALGRHYAASFPGFHLLYSPSTGQDFFQNVGHVQHKCRLHALALLRQHGPQLPLRDVLRVFIPFLMSAIKDFAQGKRDRPDMTEGRAKGYCDAVLMTIAALTERMPWEAYYRVLTLFLSNAGINASLRMPMLRGVVQVLQNFHFLDTPMDEETAEADPVKGATLSTADSKAKKVDDDDDDDDDELEDDDAAVQADVARRRQQFRHQRLLHVLEQDVLPQLFSFIGSGKEGQKTLGLTGELKGSNMHTATSVRKEQESEDKAVAKHAILQLPVALAVTRIVKHFPEDRFDFYVDHLMDELVKKLRTKNDRHRDSARRILGAMLQETGPSKLRPIITKLQDNLIHGYQLHVLGYTVVTLLFQLYEPQSVSTGSSHGGSARPTHRQYSDPVAEALEDVKKRKLESQRSSRRQDEADQAEEKKFGASRTATPSAGLTEEEKADMALEEAEQDLIDQLLPHATAFDHAYGVTCLTNLLDQLITIFLDDYLGEVSAQKEQVELMSKMVEIKSSRAMQGFAFLARHADAARMMEVFLQKVAWVLTPPSDTSVDANALHGSAKVKALMMHELRTKYVNVSKNASADLVFVNKVRLVAVRVARGLMMNPSMRIEQSFQQVRDLLTRHNATREEKIRAFEAKDGTRRIRGNAHLLTHKADRLSMKEQLDKNFVVAPVPERVDLDFSAHTVLATQQRQKLRLYKGRYGKDLKEAAKDFYREDPATAVVLDTMDEFLLKYLLSVLKQVLGIGKERRFSKAAVQLDLLRHNKSRAEAADAEEEEGPGGVAQNDDDDGESPDGEGHADDEAGEEKSIEGEEDASDEAAIAALDPQELDAEDDDALDAFAEAQAEQDTRRGDKASASRKDRSTAALLAKHNLTAAFIREHRPLLESLVPVVVQTLEGEGSDPVVGNALDCLLALVSLRPPLEAVHEMEASLLDTVAGFLMRGGPIKQRAMRVCAALISHQKFTLSEEQAARLVALARGEMVERSEFLPMALSLFHAVLRKHIHIVEIYDLVDLVTELLVHLGAKRGIRYRCVQIVVRFLTEYKLTPEKFRSHINLFCRNLDYPELSGTLALLDLLDALAYRLPTVVLRDEAPVWLPPLTAVVLRGQWREARERAGQVIQHLAKLAGVDVLVPLLSSWMDPAKPRPTRQMASQVWATMIPAIAAVYGLDREDTANAPDDADEAEAPLAAHEVSSLRDARDAFDQSCAWSFQAILNGCLYNQYEAAGGKKVAKGTTLNAKFKAKAEMKGWEHVFYSLRCAEALFAASPARMYQRLGPALLPVLIDHLMLHTHPWVQAVAVRILRHYVYTFVEPRSGFLATDSEMLASPVARTVVVVEEGSANAAISMPLVVPPVGEASLAQLEEALRGAAHALKQCLSRVAMCDVSNEVYNAHRAINSPSRAESLKLMVYLLRSVCVLALRMRLLADDVTSDVPASTRRAVLATVEKELGLIRRQLESIASPVVRQGRVVNYMVRTATLVQFFGALTSVLPTPATVTVGDDDEEATLSEDDVKRVNEAASWLMGGRAFQVLRLVHDVAAPLVGIALRAANISDRLSTLAHQSAAVMSQQLEERRPLLRSPRTSAKTGSKRSHDEVSAAEASHEEAERTAGVKKQKKEGSTTLVKSAAASPVEAPALEVVLSALTTHMATVRQERRVKQITHDTHKSMRRNRREMEKGG